MRQTKLQTEASNSTYTVLASDGLFSGPLKHNWTLTAPTHQQNDTIKITAYMSEIYIVTFYLNWYIRIF